MLPVYLHVTGYNFNGMLGFATPSAYGFVAGAPAYPEIMGIASGTWVLGAVMIIGFTLGLFIWLPQTMVLISRSMFAWSFDRIMPERLSQVDARTHSPVIAIAIVTLLAIGSTAIYAFTTWFSTLSVLLGLTLTLLVTAVGAIVLPYRQREMVENSPYGGRFAGMPVLTIVGVLAVLGFAAAIAVLLWDPGSGASLSENPGQALAGARASTPSGSASTSCPARCGGDRASTSRSRTASSRPSSACRSSDDVAARPRATDRSGSTTPPTSTAPRCCGESSSTRRACTRRRSS